ncbi:uncharacterized protein LOC110430389 [Sorghum bicolor]|uniref:uncharacterized protein LOC110430389 n=1 Tax=Sorghum bicolor TaxID=4558 RepID=UPI000B425433|nr:uncharacterized protein LOC110430389 [Sorghum bicolor]|eukprot:XP_021303727.1 uncharacterized protein LOC110430389 [Sorghum bicolor]
MSARYVGKEKIPLRADGCTLQLRQQRSGLYIWSTMPSSNRGWQSAWFYLRNDGGLLPKYTGKMVTEAPQKWVWGAPAEEEKRLAPLVAGLQKLREARVTAATVAIAFHKRSLLPLAQHRVPMFEMTRDVPWAGTKMLAEPISASDITARVEKTTTPETKNSRVVPMRPEKGYISLGIGAVKDSPPPVPEDKEIRAMNRARNEEQKKVKEGKKAKAARRAERREIASKNRREAEKAGVAPHPSPETSVSEIEGEGGDVDWLDELMEEDDAVPPAGGIEAPEGSKAQGGSETPEGTQAPGGGQPVPHIIVDDEDSAPREDSAPVGLQEGEKASEAEPEEAPQSVAPEGPAEPTPASGTGAGAPVEVSQAEATMGLDACGRAGVKALNRATQLVGRDMFNLAQALKATSQEKSINVSLPSSPKSPSSLRTDRRLSAVSPPSNYRKADPREHEEEMMNLICGPNEEVYHDDREGDENPEGIDDCS